MARTVRDLALFSGTISDPTLNATLAQVEAANADRIRAEVKNTGVTGTTPSITLKLQSSVNGVDWDDEATFTAITAAQRQKADVAIVYASLFRLVASAKSGTTPALTGVTVSLHARGA